MWYQSYRPAVPWVRRLSKNNTPEKYCRLAASTDIWESKEEATWKNQRKSAKKDSRLSCHVDIMTCNRQIQEATDEIIIMLPFGMCSLFSNYCSRELTLQKLSEIWEKQHQLNTIRISRGIRSYSLSHHPVCVSFLGSCREKKKNLD